MNITKLLCIILLCASTKSIYCQIQLGANFGIHIPGKQDLKFKKYDDKGRLTSIIKTSETESTSHSFAHVHITHWKNKYGIRLGYLEWEHMTIAEEFRTSEQPNISATEQSRRALFVSLIKRYDFSMLSNRLNKKSCIQVGGGYGRVISEIDHGLPNNNRGGFQLFSSLDAHVAPNIHLSIEAKYLISHDADNTSGPHDQTVIDTSGTWSAFRFGPHFDTRYYMFSVGLNWSILP